MQQGCLKGNPMLSAGVTHIKQYFPQNNLKCLIANEFGALKLICWYLDISHIGWKVKPCYLSVDWERVLQCFFKSVFVCFTRPDHRKFPLIMFRDIPMQHPFIINNKEM